MRRGCFGACISNGFDMAAAFLVLLYEYSPPFYISVIALCFIVTAAMVLGRFGFDVPVILRSSDDTDLLLNIPEKRMVQVKNPFALDIGSTAGSVTGGVGLRPYCLESCVLTCYWGCTAQSLQAALQCHQFNVRINTPQRFEEALNSDYQHSQTFFIDKEDTQERLCQLPDDLGITDFGLLPRSHYPLVALLTLAEPEARELYEIAANVTVIHVPDDKYRLSSRILYHYILTASGNVYDLKQLYMSADGKDWSGVSGPPSGETVEGRGEENPEEPQSEAGTDPETEGDGETGLDCVVCQYAPVNRVLLPCRHTCVCDGCVSRFRHCPVCRAFVMESFALSPPSTEEEEVGRE